MKFWKEFKAFISKGNIIDLAVAVVIGNAFNKIVSSLVNDVIMPLISLAVGGADVSDWKWVIKEAVYDAEGNIVTAESALTYGIFIQSIIDFLLIALTIFVVLKIMVKSSSMFKGTAEKLKGPSKEEKVKLVEMGVDVKNKKAVNEALNKIREDEANNKAEQDKQAKEDAYRNSTEGLLKEIRDLMKEQNNQNKGE